MRGRITRIVTDRGFGFIGAEGQDYFFHMTALANRTFDTIEVGDPVEFSITDRGRGPRAQDVRVI